jgi:hypothetical protein
MNPDGSSRPGPEDPKPKKLTNGFILTSFFFTAAMVCGAMLALAKRPESEVHADSCSKLEISVLIAAVVFGVYAFICSRGYYNVLGWGSRATILGAVAVLGFAAGILGSVQANHAGECRTSAAGLYFTAIFSSCILFITTFLLGGHIALDFLISITPEDEDAPLLNWVRCSCCTLQQRKLAIASPFIALAITSIALGAESWEEQCNKPLDVFVVVGAMFFISFAGLVMCVFFVQPDPERVQTRYDLLLPSLVWSCLYTAGAAVHDHVFSPLPTLPLLYHRCYVLSAMVVWIVGAFAWASAGVYWISETTVCQETAKHLYHVAVVVKVMLFVTASFLLCCTGLCRTETCLDERPAGIKGTIQMSATRATPQAQSF